ncbi:MAG: histidine phosphatase family protein [Pseudomonadota bacterium]
MNDRATELPSPFFFLRHGESENNRRDLVNGWTDCALTDRGREQARAAVPALQDENIALVITSTLSRTRETAQIVADALGVDVQTHDGLKERNWGVLENGPRAALTDYFSEPEGAESWEQYRERVWNTLSSVTLPARPLIVGHAGTMRVLRDHLKIGDVQDRLPNAVPVRFTQDANGVWSFAADGE